MQNWVLYVGLAAVFLGIVGVVASASFGGSDR